MNFKLNGKETKSRSRRFLLLAISFFLIAAIQQTGAGTLDAQAAKSLVSGHTWQVKFTSGTVAFWTWKSDGSLCPRQNLMSSTEPDRYRMCR